MVPFVRRLAWSQALRSVGRNKRYVQGPQDLLHAPLSSELTQSSTGAEVPRSTTRRTGVEALQTNRQIVSEGNADIMTTSYYFETDAIALSLH